MSGSVPQDAILPTCPIRRKSQVRSAQSGKARPAPRAYATSRALARSARLRS